MDYSIFYRRCISTDRISKELPKFDIFVSAYNSSERVRYVFEAVRAKRKIWILHPEYCYPPLDEPTNGEIARPDLGDEISQVNSILNISGEILGKKICIDITGFMRHVLIFLVAKLSHMGVKEIGFIYSEPIAYSKQEDTQFSTTTSGLVRPVRGMAGSNSSNGHDHLIIGVGYDHKLISEVVNSKDDASVYPIFAFPSLSADMYQQSATKASESGDVALRTEWVSNRHFAPANDPFETAGVISSVISDIDRRGEPANIYLAPLSTKAQTLGFALYWVLEGRNRGGVSILLPECTTYSHETSTGIRRLWYYTVEFF